MDISLLDLILSFGSSVPGRRSVRCICAKVTFPCRMVSFTTGLTGWVDKSRSSDFLILCNVCVSIVGNFIVGVRVCLTTIIIIIIIIVFISTIPVISGLVFFSFELTALVLIMTWLSSVVASWFGLF